MATQDKNSADVIYLLYVGNKTSKTDKTYGTGIVWAGKGDVQAVPVDSRLARHYGNHPDIWELVTDGEVVKSAAVDGNAGASEALSGLADVDAATDDNPPGNAPVEPVRERFERITSAIGSLNMNDPNHFTRNGSGPPKIEVVREAADDETISVKEVNEAWSIYCESKAADDADRLAAN